MIEVTRKRQAATHEDFLVRGVGKRAIHVVIPFDYNSSKPVSELLSEFELYWLIVDMTKHINKQYHWKCFTIKTYWLSSGVRNAAVSATNCAGFTTPKNKIIGQLIDIDHFTNDAYLCPKYFYIKKYIGGKEPWQKRKDWW